MQSWKLSQKVRVDVLLTYALDVQFSAGKSGLTQCSLQDINFMLSLVLFSRIILYGALRDIYSNELINSSFSV